MINCITFAQTKAIKIEYNIKFALNEPESIIHTYISQIKVRNTIYIFFEKRIKYHYIINKPRSFAVKKKL